MEAVRQRVFHSSVVLSNRDLCRYSLTLADSVACHHLKLDRVYLVEVSRWQVAARLFHLDPAESMSFRSTVQSNLAPSRYCQKSDWCCLNQAPVCWEYSAEVSRWLETVH